VAERARKSKKRSCWRLLAIAFAGVLLGACSVPDSPEDLKLKSALVGSWYYEYKDAGDRVVKGVLHPIENGTFSLKEKTERVGNSRIEQSAGVWRAADGLLKMVTKEVEGKGLGTNQITYFTSRITATSANAFSCTDDNAKQSYTYQRVGAEFKLE
jgi:hypothetical protein